MSLQMAGYENARNAIGITGLAGRYGVQYANASFPQKRGSRKKNAQKGFGAIKQPPNVPTGLRGYVRIEKVGLQGQR